MFFQGVLNFFENFFKYFFPAPLMSAQRLSALFSFRKFCSVLIYNSNVWRFCFN